MATVGEPSASFSDEASAVADEAFISVRSVWKVFGKDPEKVLSPEYAGKDKAFFQSEFNNVIGLHDVSFDVQRGDTFVIMGLSGSGKSTMVRCLLRLIEPTAGEIKIDGEDITKMSEKALLEFRRTRVAMVFQHYGLMPHRCVLDNACWGLEVQGVKQDERYARTREVLSLVGLAGWEDAYPRQLSGGMQQRVGLARALAMDTDILLMDEPFSGLDPLIRRQMQDELLRLQSELQKTIVFITHDLNEALKLGDRIAIMHDGQVAQIGSPEDIVLRPEDEYVGEFTQDVRLETVLTASRVMVPPRATVRGDQGPQAVLDAIGSNARRAAWVVDAHGGYIGMLSGDNAERAVQAGVSRLDQDGEYVVREYAAVPLTANFDELIPLAMSRNFPIPVVDADNILIGEVRRRALAEALAETSAAEADYEANAAENASLAAEA